MKNIFKLTFAASLLAFSVTSCIEEIDPQTSTVTAEQAANAPGAFDNFVAAVTSNLSGNCLYSGSNYYPYDYGYPAFFMQRDLMGMDMLVPFATGSEWFTSWYTISSGITNTTGIGSYLPWFYFYKYIDASNAVLKLCGEEPSEDQYVGAGIAYTIRALSYLELAQMFGTATYTADTQGLTVPLVKDTSTSEELAANPRATNADMYASILEDLDNAEKYLANYTRPDKTTPDISVVYGLKARAYLLMGDWANAKSYAEKAMVGYTMLSPSDLTDKVTGFNTPNDAWMFCYTTKSTDFIMIGNDCDTGWGAQMIVEGAGHGCGYTANYVGPKRIDKHLYETIPYSDYRKKQFVDFSLDELETNAEKDAALLEYTGTCKDGSISIAYDSWYDSSLGGVPVKFRPHNANYDDQYDGFLVSIPFMRVEEMKLIQAEAAGRLNEAEGIALLTAFATARDPEYVYGTHTDSYNNNSMSQFIREVWWQRRVELWGEGFSFYDIKRLGTGIIRSYAGTNHLENYRWNTQTVPDWFYLLIPSSEANNNEGIVQSPIFSRPTADSPEYAW